MNMKKDYLSWSKSELVKEIKKLEKRKRYGLVWEDKPEKVAELCKEKFPVLKEDSTKEIKIDNNKPVNILIEGDNYHALSVLNYTHKGKIDVIYIDPPYNTGNKDFSYNDKYVDKEDTYRHSKWISFIMKRLKLARGLLKHSGVIFISIGEQEVHNLRHICDELFGENSIGQFVRQGVKGGTRAQSIIATNHDYVLVYAKNPKTATLLGKVVDSLSLTEEDEKGMYRKGRELNKWGAGSRRRDAPKMFFSISGPGGKGVFPIRNDGSEGRWRWGKKKLLKAVKENDVIFEKRYDGTYIVYEKVRTKGPREIAHASLLNDSIYSNATGTEELKDIFNGKSPFSYPKPSYLIEYLVSMMKNKDALVLDFFAGSGTTAHAVLRLNKKDNGKRRFILCTDNQDNAETGLKIATDICLPRVEKVIKGYKNQKNQKVEGFSGNLKYFKTDFVDAGITDNNKKKLVDKSTEMLCLKENCYEEVKKDTDFKIFKNSEEKYLGIIYDDDGIDAFKKEVKKLNKKFIVYVFSLDESAREEEFRDMIEKVELRPIPAVILNVYKRIFK
jgi:adenine-specific DNA-methyltransferase